MKKILIITMVLLLIVGFAACKGDKAENTPEPTAATGTKNPSSTPSETQEATSIPGVSETPTEEPTPEPPKEKVFVLPDESIRPWAVSIDNQGDKPFPQGGLADAQVIYELPVEGGLSRYLALFWEANVDLIGPVRSARDYMLDCFVPYDAILVHVGGSPQALSDIRDNSNIDYLNAMINAGSIFEELTDDPKNWQDTYTTGEKVGDFVSSKGIDETTDVKVLPEYNDVLTVPSDGLDANIVNITYNDDSRCAYIYDKEKMVYYRNRNGTSHIDRNTDKPFSVANIIVQKVDSRVITGDTEGRLEVEMVGSGTGYFVTGGKSIEITWEKAERFGATKYYDHDGKEIVLNPGNTWIQVTIASTMILIL